MESDKNGVNACVLIRSDEELEEKILCTYRDLSGLLQDHRGMPEEEGGVCEYAPVK